MQKKKLATKRKSSKKSTTSRTTKSRRRKTKPITTLKYEIDIKQLMLHSRQVFLYGEINEKSANYINRELLALAEISSDPIAMWINSGGGSVLDGFSIIDTMRGLSAPVVTFICGKACSMAGLISIVGAKRTMTAHSHWMAHEMRGGGDYDYSQKLFDRIDFVKLLDKQIHTHLLKHTKLTPAEVNRAFRGELWLTPDKCLEKGIIDGVAKV